MAVMRLVINFVSRILTILLNWIMLEAFMQENMFRYIQPGALGLESTGLIDLLMVAIGSFLWILAADYFKTLPKKLRNCFRKHEVNKNIETDDKQSSTEDEAGFPDENIQTDSKTVFPRRMSVFCKYLDAISLELTSSLILMTYASSLLAPYPNRRLAVVSVGAGMGALHIRQAINSKSSEVTDIPCAALLSMLLRFSTHTVALTQQNFLPSLTLALLVVGFKLVTYIFPPKYTVNHVTNRAEEDVVSNQPMGYRIRVMTQCTSFNYVTVLVYSSSIGTLGWLTSYIALTPSTLSRWSDSNEPFLNGIVLNISLTFGCLAAIALSQRLQKLQSSDPMHNFQSFGDVIITSIVIASWALGVHLQVGVTNWKSNIGGCLLMLAYPSVWVLCLKPLSYLNLGQAENRGLLVAFLVGSGAVGLAFYVVGVFTLYSLPTPIFWNQMWAVLWVASFVLFTPIFGRSTIYVYNCIAVARSEFSLENVENFNFSALFKKQKESKVLEDRKRSKNRKNLTESVVVVAITFLVIFRGIYLDTEPKEISASSNSLKVLSWNIMAGREIYGKHNFEGLAKVLKTQNPDIIGLQESDVIYPFLSGSDYVYYLTKQLGMYANYGPNPMNNGGGDASILSKYKIIKRHSELLPATDWPVFNYGISSVSILLPTDNTVLTIANVHLTITNIEGSNKTFESQVNRTVEFLNQIPDPVIITGDFNIDALDPRLKDIYSKANMTNAYTNYSEADNITTYMVEYNNGQPILIDHIFYRGLKLKKSTKILGFDKTSDHCPIMAEFDLNF